ncbi:MAG: small nuclear ribonucleoprotein [Candidatus Thermoplasmatota archaeon]|jgi:small nuclear ribonucleoprotein|nr:small nuclear ribonucleoprotein [Candidatus Thermoplasmatota archaeon]MCL5989204.1 small nuclear ribonucleoprotein [Candidatus Thermoplasmatota archaeon]
MPKPVSSALKPMDVLRGSLNSSVLVDVRGNRGYSGILEGYDVYMNLVIRDAAETIGGQDHGMYPRILVRGDNVIYVSPVNSVRGE